MGRDDDRTWAELVENFHSSSDDKPQDGQRRWPEAEDVASDDEDDDYLHSPTFTAWIDAGERDEAKANEPAPAGDLDGEGDEGGDRDDRAANHFEPPPPPPIPRGDAVSRAAWAGVLGSPALLVLLSLLQWSPPGWMTFALVAGFVGGFVVLIARLRGHHPDDPDNGAVV